MFLADACAIASAPEHERCEKLLSGNLQPIRPDSSDTPFTKPNCYETIMHCFTAIPFCY
jgi:hypothetical protein